MLRKITRRLGPIFYGIPGAKTVHRWWLKICVAIPIIADMHYLFTGEFRREHRAVLAGKLRFLNLSKFSPEAMHYTLRRNIHRLEKGLIMQPRRPAFAADYIEETVQLYVSILQSGLSSAPPEMESQNISVDQTRASLLEWSASVLSAYFGCVSTSDSRILSAKALYLSTSDNQTLSSNLDCAPYQRRSTEHQVTPNAFYDLCLQRRSVRWYSDKKVPDHLVEEAVRIASLSPSACNRQPFRFVITRDPSIASRLGAIPMGTVGFSHQFPAFIIVVGDLSAYVHERDRHLIYVDGGLVSMSLILALETLGLSSCCINWPDIEERERSMGEALKLETHERPIMCISFGYAAEKGMVPFSQKKSFQQLIQYV